MAAGPLTEPFQIGEPRLPNRVVMTPVKLGYGNRGGEVNERHIACWPIRIGFARPRRALDAVQEGYEVARRL